MQAGEAEPTTARHASYYLSLLEGAVADLRGPRQREALAQIEADIMSTGDTSRASLVRLARLR